MDGRTIAAISTPRGKGGVAMIRISGEDAFAIASRVFAPASGKPLSSYKPNTAVYGRFSDSAGAFDDGMAVLYATPHSFTGEDTAELCCHGGMLVTEKLLAAVIAAGADWAGAGEFTKRAFINGKLSLTQAEAVAGLIDAPTERHLGVSLLQLEGSLSRKIEDIYRRLAHLAASVYAYIDYPDEDMTDISPEEMKASLREVLSELDALYESRKYGKAISEGVNAVIVGRPNTGKSSLLNLFSGTERAIVTDIEGTTRDIVTEKITVGNIVLNLSDTAGIRESNDTIEKIGIARSGEALKNAELVILVLENELTASDAAVTDAIHSAGKDACTVALYNKSDKAPALPCGAFEREIVFSAKTGEGKDALCRAIAEICGESECGDAGTIVVSARQFGAISRARESIGNALRALDSFTQDIAGMDIEDAMQALGETDGKAVSEEIVNDIFSRFCVGK